MMPERNQGRQLSVIIHFTPRVRSQLTEEITHTWYRLTQDECYGPEDNLKTHPCSPADDGVGMRVARVLHDPAIDVLAGHIGVQSACNTAEPLSVFSHGSRRRSSLTNDDRRYHDEREGGLPHVRLL